MRKYLPVCLCLLLLVMLSGCRKQAEAAAMWNDLQTGDDLCARSSNGAMAEVEQGYYFCHNETLYYADRSDLSNWVPVCGRPDCEHVQGDRTCNASMHEFLLSGGRIYFCGLCKDYGLGEQDGMALFSIAPDGSERKLEHVLEAGSMENCGQSRCFILPDCLLAFFSTVDANGLYSNCIVQVDRAGEHVLYSGLSEDPVSVPGMTAGVFNGLTGDLAFYSGFLAGEEETFQKLYTIRDGKIQELAGVAGMQVGGWLSGTVMRQFVPNEGYYDVDLATGERHRFMDAQLTDSFGGSLWGDFLVEYRLVGTEERAIRFFDGTLWHDVAIPQDFTVPEGGFFYPKAWASDRIFFCTRDSAEGAERLYQVLLQTDAPELTACGMVGA